MTGSPRSRLLRQRGAALLMAIATVGLLSAVAVEIAGSTLDETHLAEAFRDELKARWAVQAPLAIAVSALRGEKDAFTSRSQKWARLEETLTLDGVSVRFRIHDESGKVNLNALASSDAARREGTAQALKKMFETLELDANLVDFLRDWVDADSAPRLAGSEASHYQSLPSPYTIKNAPLDSLTELRLVRGFDPKALKVLGFQEQAGSLDLGLNGRLTVYSEERINVNTAAPLVLQSLAEDLPEDFVRDLVARRGTSPIRNLADIKKLAGMNDTLFNKLAPMLTVESTFFSVEAETTGGRVRKRLLAVLKKESNRVSVVYWRML